MEAESTQVYTPPTIIAEVAAFLGQPIPEADEDREVHIIALDALRHPLAVATADALKLRYEKRRQVLYPKDMPGMKLTELDRETNMDAMTAPIERDYQLLLRLTEIVDQRINLLLFLMD